MKDQIELLAPGGDIDSIKAAILAGANAIYCGLDRFNARNSAPNISFDDLQGILKLAHKNNCQVFLTLNIIILENEISDLVNLLNRLINTNIDGLIIQDLGLFYILNNYFKSFKIHASTQLTTHNQGQIKFLSKLNASRVNLSRELNIHEIEALTRVGKGHNVSTEVFVHGSNCISFSGICYFSSVQSGNSGNRGRCSQPCRGKYLITNVEKNYPLNLKDNSAFFDLKDLTEAGVYSLKIEGRIKKFDYVYTIVKTWRRHLDNFYQNKISDNNSDLYRVFNRDFSNSFLRGDIHRNMFIDNPRDHSIQHLSDIHNYTDGEELELDKLKFYDEKEKIKSIIKNKIDQLSIAKIPIIINISGEKGAPLKTCIKTPDSSFIVLSKKVLSDSDEQSLSYDSIFKRFKAIDETEYFIQKIDLAELSNNLYIPFKEITLIKKRILYILNNSKKLIEPTELPKLNRQTFPKTKPDLSLLISSPNDINLSSVTSADIYFQLPSCLKNNLSELVGFFKSNKKLIPWFQSVLIGDEYEVAVDFLKQVQPEIIVTNNTGIAFEAYERGISWIAGPYLNIVNSYSLQCLKEYFNCSGAFISNEINKNQIRRIVKPENFKLYYSIYHPILLMTSRQCLFHQVTGCKKDSIHNDCIQNCEKFTSITNLKKESFYIKKTKGNYNQVYGQNNFLNTDIVYNIPNFFDSFFVDLRDVKTETEIEMDKLNIINHFQELINGNINSGKEIRQIIHPTINIQYKKGF